ncbi:flagellar filament capping protein FliD [Pacificimonas sp. WHA3]|uniref:Flagellar hook-associated protein 2 n=1 Tax=Pacificimonas pallii TaxID=2827236 RepID=A0ABS6SF02_9SPHN|nr:flagellar filament capping protein FliD [Pacificimonas pallii]MBV7256989.1 flagellar filament capping protein FliD [Pacificimonas pallii]
MNDILASLGAGSGLNTSAIVAGLVAAERDPAIARLNGQREEAEARISALGQVRAGVSAFSQALSALGNSGVLGVLPRLSNDDLASITRVDDGPAVGNISFSIEQLAARQSTASSGFASSDAAIGTGSLTITFGNVTGDGNGSISGFTADADREALVLNVTESDGTLDGVARLINEANEGISATVVNDGNEARLILKGAEGEIRGFTVDVAADVPGSDLEKLSFNVGNAQLSLQSSAANAILDVEGVTVTRDSNSIDDLVAGVRLDLNKAEPGTKITLDNAYDVEELTLGIRNFVGAFNEVQGLLSELGGGIGPDNAGPLAGSQALRAITAELRGLTTQLLGDGIGPSRLADIGISSTRNGQLVVDNTRLSALASSDPASISDLFIDSQSTQIAGLQNLSGLDGLPAGDYKFENLVPGTSGFLTGEDVGNAFVLPLSITDSNNVVDLNIDGVTSSFTLANGSYASGTELAAAFQTALGDKVNVEFTDNKFVFTSEGAGSNSGVSFAAMDAALQSDLGLLAPTATPGTDASGTVNGEALTGDGNSLSYTAQNGTVISFAIGIPVAEANIGIFDGLATRLSRIADAAGLPSGSIGAGLARLQREQAAFAETEQRIESRSENYEERLRRQFGAMEAAVAQFRSTREFLTQQIDLWTNQNN